MNKYTSNIPWHTLSGADFQGQSDSAFNVFNVPCGVAPPPHENVLEEANRLIHGPRQGDYGHPFDDFSRTAEMWSGLWRDKLTSPLGPEDVAMALICVKLSREQNHPKRDSAVDIAGYAGTLAMVRERQGRYSR